MSRGPRAHLPWIMAAVFTLQACTGGRPAPPTSDSGRHASSSEHTQSQASDGTGQSARADSSRSTSGASDVEEPTSAAPVILDIELDGGFPILTWSPGGTQVRPVVISAHGAGCRAEQHCEYLWRLSGGRAIVACLRGEPLFRARPEQGFYFRDHFALGRELGAAVVALRAHFAERLGASWTFVGYSQGATMGALALPEASIGFEQLVFIEGGGEGMATRSVERLRDLGTARVLFACGTRGCAQRARGTASALVRAGLDARAFEAAGAGHTYLGAVEELIAGQLDWLWP